MNKTTANRSIFRLRKAIATRFSLKNDKAADALIDEHLRAGVELVGATPWILMFAILIACIGLNVNSTAVIIGAMLISPLMGPIMGVGYGIGIYDFALVKKSFINLGIATLISFVTASIYFSLTPLSAAQAELLARPSPTLWDVLIAVFGGLAGVVAATRQEKTNVVPGVAIATALMPPLCTAGYGFSQGNWTFFAGALYLFAINCVFIAVSTVIVITLLHMPHQVQVNPITQKKIKNGLLLIAGLTMLPSIFLAYNLVRHEIFKNKAWVFVRSEFQFQETHVADVAIDPSSRIIEVSLIGHNLDKGVVARLNEKLPAAGLPGATVVVHQGADNRVDVDSLKRDILGDLYRETLTAIEQRDKKIQELESRLAMLSQQESISKDILAELKAQYPDFDTMVIGQGLAVSSLDVATNRKVHMLKILTKSSISNAEKEKIERWFRARSKDISAEIAIDRAPKRKRLSSRR